MTEPRRSDPTLTLLAAVTASAVEQEYAAAARRRADGPVATPGPAVPDVAGTRSRPRVLAVALALLLGLLTGVAAADVRRAASAEDPRRALLVEDVREGTARTDRLGRDAGALRAELDRRRAVALAADAEGREVAAALARVSLAAAVTAVTGPGLVVTLDDADGAQDDGALAARGGAAGDGRVLDRDLQSVANALWAAGAEAVSINDQRLTVLTAIRAAGEALLVDKRPLTPPYVVRAVGDPGQLEPRFADSAAGRRLRTYTELYGLRLQVERAERLTLPAARLGELVQAQPGVSPSAIPSGPSAAPSADPSADPSTSRAPGSRGPSPSGGAR